MKLHYQILLAMCLGVAIGGISRMFGFEAWVIEDLSVLGTVFIRLLKMIVLPLVLTSVITGIASLGANQDGSKMFARTFGFYLFSSLLAIMTGLIVVNVVRPGVGVDQLFSEVPKNFAPQALGVTDLIINMIPTNPFAAAAEGQMLPTIFFAILFGWFVTHTAVEHRDTVINFFEAVFQVMMAVTHFIIKLAPIGVFALMAKVVAETGFSVFIPLGWYVLAVTLSLFIHAGISLPLIIKKVTGRSPREFAQAMSPALLTAFSTASSSATLPLTLESVEKRAGVPNRVAGFTLPLGATINMDGTALYECVAVIFIAQVYGVDLTAGQQVIVVLTALLASIGAAGIPMAGLVMMSVILNAVGLPLEGIGLILAVDRILDMMRTTVNVWSDSVCAAVVAHFDEKDQAALAGQEA